MQTNSLTLPTANSLANPMTHLSFADADGGIQLASQANIDILRHGSLSATREQCRAMLAYTALENVVLLSALEAQCYRTAPFGEERYKKIVDAYTAGAVTHIFKF